MYNRRIREEEEEGGSEESETSYWTSSSAREETKRERKKEGMQKFFGSIFVPLIQSFCSTLVSSARERKRAERERKKGEESEKYVAPPPRERDTPTPLYTHLATRQTYHCIRYAFSLTLCCIRRQSETYVAHVAHLETRHAHHTN
jgi:hypothetical protein